MESRNTRNDIVIQRYTHKDLARLYEVSWKTLQKWLKADEHLIGQKVGHFYSAKQVERIFELRGYPKISVYSPGKNSVINHHHPTH